MCRLVKCVKNERSSKRVNGFDQFLMKNFESILSTWRGAYTPVCTTTHHTTRHGKCANVRSHNIAYTTMKPMLIFRAWLVVFSISFFNSNTNNSCRRLLFFSARFVCLYSFSSSLQKWIFRFSLISLVGVNLQYHTYDRERSVWIFERKNANNNQKTKISNKNAQPV